MVRRSYNAVIERNVEWKGAFETEPYEVGWASEAIFFIRSLEGSGDGAQARVQITPDGMHWCDEGTALSLPGRAGSLPGKALSLPGKGGVTFCKVTNFGNWIRLVGETDRPVKVLVTLSLKE